MTLGEMFTLDRTGETEKRAAATGCRVYEVTASVLAKIADTETPRGPIATLQLPPPAPLSTTDTVLLDGVADPGNAGTIIRSAAAFGFAVAVTPTSVDAWSPKTLRAAAGAHFMTPVVTVDGGAARQLMAAELHAVALVVAGGRPIETIDDKAQIALIVGSESHGISSDLLDLKPTEVTLDMPGGIESLNAGVAASIAMYLRRRKLDPPEAIG